MKNHIRKLVQEKRNSLSEHEWEASSEEISKKLRGSNWYKNAKTVFTFVSMGHEVDTHKLIQQSWRDGKQVAVPIAKENGEIYFVPVDSFEELEKTSFGVLEPKKSKLYEITPKDTDIFLVPGLVFDTKGNRYGYGGGFYDRYAKKYPKLMKIALCFAFQVKVEPLIIEIHDIPVEVVFTEKGILGGSNYEYFN